MLKALISLVRPKQWVKNLFVGLPLFFGGKLLSAWCWEQTILTFLAFSMVASSIYCLNDLRDVEADRAHPKKCRRPLASGRLKPIHAVSAMLLTMGIGLGISLLMPEGRTVFLILLIYLVLNIAYCFKLKQYAIIDVFIVSFGFVLRLLAGGVSCRIWLSPWIVLMTFLLALFLALGKRRDDVVLFENDKVVTRKNVEKYNLPFINQTLVMVGTITIICYIMYTLSPDVIERFHNSYIYVTSVFVLLGILRYLQVSLVENKSGSPTQIVLHDGFIQICLLFWGISFAILLYL